MIRLDHFVINIDNDMARLDNLAGEIKDKGYPFKPKWGKGTKGFKVANIWMGLQYFEMVWLKKLMVVDGKKIGLKNIMVAIEG